MLAISTTQLLISGLLYCSCAAEREPPSCKRSKCDPTNNNSTGAFSSAFPWHSGQRSVGCLPPPPHSAPATPRDRAAHTHARTHTKRAFPLCARVFLSVSPIPRSSAAVPPLLHRVPALLHQPHPQFFSLDPRTATQPRTRNDTRITTHALHTSTPVAPATLHFPSPFYLLRHDVLRCCKDEPSRARVQ